MICKGARDSKGLFMQHSSNVTCIIHFNNCIISTDSHNILTRARSVKRKKKNKHSSQGLRVQKGDMSDPINLFSSGFGIVGFLLLFHEFSSLNISYPHPNPYFSRNELVENAEDLYLLFGTNSPEDQAWKACPWVHLAICEELNAVNLQEQG